MIENNECSLVRPIRDNHKQNTDQKKRVLNPIKSIIRAVGVMVDKDYGLEYMSLQIEVS